MFHERYRYTGAGLGYNLAGILGGAIPPLIAAKWVADGNQLWVGFMLAGLSAVSVLCCYLMVETKDHDIVETASADRDDAQARRGPRHRLAAHSVRAPPRSRFVTTRALSAGLVTSTSLTMAAAAPSM